MTKDICVIIIKLVDRLHNLKTIGYLKPERQQIIAHESLEIYSAIAHRLEMRVVISKKLRILVLKLLIPFNIIKLFPCLNQTIKNAKILFDKKLKS